jgi:multidrug efflux pump
VSGVGRVSLQGGVRPAVRVQADLARLAAYRLSLADIRTAIVGANVAGPKGSLDGPAQSYTVASNDQVGAAEAYRDIVVAHRGGAPVLLKDVAVIVDGWRIPASRALRSETAVILDVQRSPAPTWSRP